MSDLEQRMDAALTSSERRRRIEYESVIERTKGAFVECGQALTAIRDERLYRDTHENFDSYCREVWGFDRNRAWQLISAAEVITTVINAGLPAPTSERQARELARVPEDQQAEVWQKVMDVTDGKPTAAAVREVVQPQSVQPVPAPTTLRDPFSVPESPTQEVEEVPRAAVLERPAQSPEEVEQAHLRRVSDDIRSIINQMASFTHPPSREKYVRNYQPIPYGGRETIPVTSESLRSAGETLIAMSELWREIRETE